MKLIPEEIIRNLCSAIEGKWGLYIHIPETGERLQLGCPERLFSASTIKIPLLALLLQDGEEGRLDLNQRIGITPDNRVKGAGILQSMSASVQLSLTDYAELMMVLSDNIATNVVIDAVGMERANAFFADQGWTSTHLARKMMKKGNLLPDGTREDNYTSVSDLADMMERILAGTLVSASVSQTMLRIMAGHRIGKFCRYLPEDNRYDPTQELMPIPAGKVVLSSKGGTLAHLGVANDAGIMLLPNGRSAVLVMMVSGGNNPETEEILAKVALALYESMK